MKTIAALIVVALLAGCATPEGLTEEHWSDTMSLIGGRYSNNNVTWSKPRPAPPAVTLIGTSIVKVAP